MANKDFGVIKRVVVTPDKHFPLHDQKAINVLKKTIEIVKPDAYFDLGDVGEWEGFSQCKFKIKKDDDGEVSRNRGKDNGEKTICDGVELVLKPLFNTENATKSGVTELGKSIRKIRINPATDTKMGWISFAPNLTGCYLVS